MSLCIDKYAYMQDNVKEVNVNLYWVGEHKQQRNKSEISQILHRSKREKFFSFPILVAISGCGGDSSPPTASNIELKKIGNVYTFSSVDGLSLKDPASPIIVVKNASGLMNSVPLVADGVGLMEFQFVPDSGELSFADGSKICGFSGLRLHSGLTDLSNVILQGVDSLELSEDADVKLGIDQLKAIQNIVVTSIESQIEIILASTSEVDNVLDIISSSSIKVYAEANPLVLVAKEDADISKDVLSAAEIQINLNTENISDAPDLDSMYGVMLNDDSIFNLSAINFENAPYGNIILNADAVTKTISLSKGGEILTNNIAYDDIDLLSVPEGATLELTSAILQLMGAEIIGEGNVVVKDINFETELNSIKVTGSIVLSGEAKADELLSLDEINANTIDATGITKAIGSSVDLKNLVDDQNTIDTAENIGFVTSGETANLSDLALIAANTTGFVNALSHSSTSGLVADGVYIFATERGVEGDAIQVSANVDVNLLEDDGVSLDATDLVLIGAATAGNVVLENAASILGSASELEAALVTAETSVIAQKSDLTVTSASTADSGVDYLSQLINLNSATVGDVLLSGTGASTALQGSAADAVLGLDGITTHSGNITLSEASDLNSGIDYLAQLITINTASSGVITLVGTAATSQLRGSADDLSTGLHEITTHAGSIELNAATTANNGIDYLAQLKAINLGTSGTITLSNTAASTALRGSAEDLSFALEGINSHSAELTIDTATTANSGIDYLSQLITINDATNGSITLTDTGATTTLQGSSNDLQAGLAGISSHTGNVIVNSASTDATTYLAHLKAINLANQGNILLANTGATAEINGSSSDIISALNGVLDYIGTATVTTRLAVSDADSIASKSTAVFSLGIGDTVANLVNADSSDVSTQLQSAVSDDNDVAIYLTDEDRSHWATDINLIEDASSGSLDLGLVNEIKLEDGVNPIFNHTTVSGKILNFIDGTGNGVAGIVYIDGSVDDDVIDLTYVTISEDDNKSLEVDAGAGDDIITGSSDNDKITGGYGSDQISLVEGGADQVYFNTTGDGAPPGSPNGYDVITGFDGASGDRLVISSSLLTRLDDDSAATLSFFHVDQDTGFAENVTLDETCEVILFSQESASIAEGDLLDTTIVANVLIDELVIDGPADGDDCLFIVESTTSGKYGLYYFSDTVNNTGTVDADELSVLAIITAEDFVTDTGDFSFG